MQNHFQVLVVSPDFEGKTVVEQHRMVYATLEKELEGAIHALGLKTLTPTQYEALKRNR